MNSLIIIVPTLLGVVKNHPQMEGLWQPGVSTLYAWSSSSTCYDHLAIASRAHPREGPITADARCYDAMFAGVSRCENLERDGLLPPGGALKVVFMQRTMVISAPAPF